MTVFLGLGPLRAQSAAPAKLAVVRHALSLNGRIEGSAQQLTGESVNFNSGAFLGGDFLVPGLPTVTVNGTPTWSGQQTGTGAATPTGYTVLVNSGVSMRYLVKRTDPVTLPTVAVPPTPAGTRQLTISSAADAAAIGAWGTVKDLTLNSGAGNVTVPAGTYGTFNASNSNNTGFTFGVAGATTPGVYNLQQLTLNSNSRLTVVGPVIINVKNQVALNSNTIVVGASGNPGWVTLNVSSAGVSVNSGAVVYGAVNAPAGKIDLNGKIVGTTASDQLSVNSGGVLQAGAATPVNQAPVVGAGAAQTISLPAAASLAGTVTDDGLPAGAAVTSAWTKASGTGTVTFANAASPTSTATFSQAGTYVLTLTASDTALSASANVTVTVNPANQAPVVSAGTNQTIALPAAATLAGSVSDDGLPAGAAVTAAWSKTSGPGVVTFANAAAPATTASFSTAGTYVLTLSASDTALSSSASVTITVTPQNQPPTVSAGANQSVALPATATLSGSATDDGLPNPPGKLALAWTKASGPGTVTFSAPAVAVTQASFSAAGSYVLSLSASDGALSSSASVTVTVIPPNQAPTVSAGAAQSVRLPAGATLAGTASDDGLPNPPGKLTLGWSQVSGPGTATFTAPAAASGAVTFDKPGAYVLRLTANDGALGTTSDVTVTVKAANLAPVVGAGANQNVTLPAAASLAGTVSDDGVPEGAAVTSTWSQVSGPGTTTFANAAAPQTSASFPVAGTYVLRLSASDTLLSATADVTVTVAPANQPPVVSAGPAQSLRLPATAILNGTATDDGLPAPARLVSAWSKVSGPGNVSFANAAAPATSAGFSAPGDYVLRLSASDSALSTAADVAVTVKAANLAPVVSAGPAIGLRAAMPAALALPGTVTDDGVPEGATLSAAWTLVSGPGQVRFADPTVAATSATFSAPGAYVLRLTGSDTALSASADVSVTVLAPNQPPVVNAGPTQTIASRPGTATLAGSASDDGLPQGSTLKLQWTAVGGPGGVVFADPASVSTTATFPVQGTYTLALSADDGQFQRTAQTTVTVTAPNQPPVVSAGPAPSVTVNVPATLAGSVTDDGLPRGGGLAVGWTKVSGPGTVAFAPADQANSQATLSQPGSYVLRLSANDGELSASADVAVTVGARVNQAPVVSAGPAQSLLGTHSARLAGRVSDDGLPLGAVLTSGWNTVSGPGLVSFADATLPTTSATFSKAGTYTLRLSATDTALSASDDVTVTVAGQNRPPTVDAGADQSAEAGAAVTLRGVASDDGLPGLVPLTLSWSKVAGPGNAAFADATSATTSVRFDQPGTYVLELAVSDGDLTGRDQATITVLPACQPAPRGLVAFWAGEGTANDLLGGVPPGELAAGTGYAPGEVGQGFSFVGADAGVRIPFSPILDVGRDFGSFTVEAWINPRDLSTEQTLFAWGGPSGAEGPVVSLNTGGVPGVISMSWLNIFFSGATLATDPGVVQANVFQHVALTVNRASGRARFYLNGALAADANFNLALCNTTLGFNLGVRPRGGAHFQGLMDEVALYDQALSGDDVRAIYLAGSTGKCHTRLNHRPQVSASVEAVGSQSVHIPVSYQASLLGTVQDDGLPAGSVVSSAWTLVAGPAPVVFANAGSPVTTVAFSVPGTYVLRLNASDSELSASGDVTVEVLADNQPVPPTVVVSPYQSGGWRYAVFPSGQVPADVGSPDYDDSGWQTGQAAFGNFGTYCGLQNTQHTFWLPNTEIVLRRWVNLPASAQNVRVSGTVDNDIAVLINGQDVTGGYLSHENCPSLDDTRINVTATSALRPGAPNLFVLRGRDRGLDCYLDAQLLVDQPVVANAGPDQYAPAGSPVALDASGSTALSGRALSYQWSQVAGPTVPLDVSDPVHPRFSAPRLATDTPLTFQLTVGDGLVVSTPARVTVNVLATPAGTRANTAPVVSAGADGSIGSVTTALQGSVTDDGLPVGAGLRAAWSVVGGPGPVVFADPSSPTTAVQFSRPGDYVLRLTGSDGELTASAQVRLTVVPGANQAPRVSAGPPRNATLSNPVNLSGGVADDGLPAGSTTVVTWSLVSGPGVVSFASPHALATTATFSAVGAYSLRLSATDGELSASAEVAVRIVPVNQPPQVNAGPDLAVSLPLAASTVTADLRGQASDDGLPAGVTLTMGWTKLTGPGAVFFADAAAAATTATFSAPGRYVLRLGASDGALSGAADVTVVVSYAGKGDGRGPGGIFLTGHDADEHAIAGRSNAPGAQHIVRCAINYVTYTKVNPRLLLVMDLRWREGGSDVGNPRQGLTASGFPNFEVADYGSGAPGTIDLHTVDFRAYDAVVVASDGWLMQDELDVLNARAADLATFINGGGGLVAFSERGGPVGGATTHDQYRFLPFVVGQTGVGEFEIGYQITPLGVSMGLVQDDVSYNYSHNLFVPNPYLGIVDMDPQGGIVSMAARGQNVTATGVENRVPTVSAGPDQVLALPARASLNGTVVDDGLPAGGTLAALWQRVSGPGSVTFTSANAAQTQASFSAPGTYVLRLTGSDGTLSASADVAVTVDATPNPARNHPPVVTVGNPQEVTIPRLAVGRPPVAGRSGKIVVNHDDATLGDPGFYPLTSPGRFARNLAAFFTGGRPGKFLVYSRNPGLTGAQLAGVMTDAGHAWTVNANPASTAPDLSSYDAVFLCGDAVDPTVLTAYVRGGGCVYLALGASTPAEEAPRWGAFLQAFGLRLPQTTYDGVVGAFAPASTHPLFAGVARLYYKDGFSIGAADPTDPATVILEPQADGGGGLFAVFDGLSDGLRLAGQVSDDGLPVGGTLVSTWTQVSGPAPALFDAPSVPGSTVHFNAPGNYVLRLSAGDSELSARADLAVSVSAGAPRNRAPLVNAGADQIVSGGDGGGRLAGRVSDDGLPSGSLVTTAWTQVNGPGLAVFTAPGSPDTRVSLGVPGVYTLRLTANDGELSGSDDVVVTLASNGVITNQPPTLNLGAPRTIAYGQGLTVDPQIGDDGLPSGYVDFSWLQLDGPGAVSFADASAAPGAGYYATALSFPAAGLYHLRGSATDGELSTNADLAVTVSSGTSQPPNVALASPAAGAPFAHGLPVTLTATAADPDGYVQSVTFLADGVPVGQDTLPALAPPRSAFSFNWTGAPVGAHVLSAVATDNSGTTTASAPVTITVTPALPAVALTYPTPYSAFAPGDRVALQASASAGGDGASITKVDFAVNGQPAGTATAAPWAGAFTPPAAGDYTVTATATDAAGQVAVSAPVLVRAAADPHAPTLVDLASPAEGQEVTAPTAVLGSVSGPTLQNWRLDYRRRAAACATWTTFARGTSAAADGSTLGTFDPTLLPNGLYDLRLVATSAGGRTDVSEAAVVVAGAMKVGRFTLAFNDLTVPLSGLPITVGRTYDSAETCPGDFGFGWNLDVSTVHVEENLPLGDSWNGASNGRGAYALADAGPHVVSVVFPDGKTYRFTPQVKIQATGLTYSLFAPPSPETPLIMDLAPQAGAQGATLRPLGWPNVFYAADDTYPGDKQFLAQPYDYFGTILSEPGGWRFATADGRAFTFDAKGKLTAMSDNAGNSLTFTPEGIFHSPSGKSVLFSRDGQGRIKTITDPAGKTLSYAYSPAGDLQGFFERGRNPLTDLPTAGYRYEATPAGESTHRLAGLLDAAGGSVAQNFYDADGRLQRTVDARGNATVFSHNLAGRTETITDRAGLVTTLRYDERGNVVDKTDPSGTRTAMAYHRFSDGTLSDLKETETITGQFTDPNGNGSQLVSRTVTTRYAYEDDAPGAAVVDDGHLRKVTDPLGHATRLTYDAQGNARTVTDALGHTVADNAFYPGTSRLQTALDALGHATAYTYDPAGNPDLETRTVSVTDARGNTAVQTLVTDHDYDGNGFLIRLAEPGGRITTFEPDALGRVRFERTARTDAAGVKHLVVTERAYDDQGRLTRTWDAEHPRAQFPDAPTSETVYDERFPDKPATTFDALRRSTAYAYNARGELETTTFPDGKTETTLFDADGRREWGIDRRGKRTHFRYDAAGRPSETWFCDEGSTDLQLLSRSEYDGAGRAWRQTDAAGVVGVSLYDDAGRRVAAVDGAGQRTGFLYDDAGRLRFATDAKGHTTEQRYDDAGRRVATVLPASRVWTPETASYRLVATEIVTVYDDLGRRAGEYEAAPVDLPLAQRRLKRFVYDGAGRLTDVVDALGQVTHYGYDEQGNPLAQTDANLHTTAYAVDNLGRRTARVLPGGQGESLTYDEAGQLRFRTDFNGRTTELRYDAAGRLRFRVPDAGAFPGEPSVEWRYSASGRRERMLDGSGETIYGYNARDQLTSKATAAGTLTYGRDGAGRLGSITSSAAGGANVAYAYDGAGRLWTATDHNRQATTTYGYDEVGNLAGVGLPNGVTSLYAYNEVNRLDTLTVSRVAGASVTRLAAYAHGLYAGGQRRAVAELGGRSATYDYDGLWRLKAETVAGATGGSPNGQVGYNLDAVGNRQSRASTLAGLNNQGVSAFDPNDRINGEGFGYDANGNTKASTAGSDTFDSFDRLVRRQGGDGSVVEITYDGDGHKVTEALTRGGVRTVSSFVVDEENPTGYAQALEERTNGVLAKVYVWGHALVSQDTFSPVNNSWTARFYGFDGHGSVRLLTDETGQVSDTYDYDGFGNLLAKQGSSDNRHLYCGEELDGALGLYNLRARLMDPQRGRFWSQDSFEGEGEEPTSLHKYNYCVGDPTNRVDPSGLAPDTSLSSVGSAGGLFANLQGAANIGLQSALFRLQSYVSFLAINNLLVPVGVSVTAGALTLAETGDISGALLTTLFSYVGEGGRFRMGQGAVGPKYINDEFVSFMRRIAELSRDTGSKGSRVREAIGLLRFQSIFGGSVSRPPASAIEGGFDAAWNGRKLSLKGPYLRNDLTIDNSSNFHDGMKGKVVSDLRKSTGGDTLVIDMLGATSQQVKDMIQLLQNTPNPQNKRIMLMSPPR